MNGQVDWCGAGLDRLGRLVVVVAGLLGAASAASASAVYPAASQQRDFLTIYSTTDIAAFEPVIRDFQTVRPDITINYVDIEAAPLYQRFLREAGEGRPQADLLLSSSMDLQIKLVNDGYAEPHVSENAMTLPAWARWRNEAFGFTFEPAVMVFNVEQMGETPLPQSRGELLSMLKRSTDKWRGRIGTYDIATSSVGYLLASQDARQGSEFGALIEAFGDVEVRVEERTGDLLDLLEDGTLAAGYNLLGSYARARVEAGAPLRIVYPQDYTLAVSRTAVLPANAPHPEAAHAFLEYLLSARGQQVLTTESHLTGIRTSEADGLGALNGARVGPLRPVALGPGLLVYLDQQKQARLLSSWRLITGDKAVVAEGD